MEADVFKLLSTIAVFLVATMWAFKNMKGINEWIANTTGIETNKKRTTTTESGTKVTITTSNTSGE